MLSNATTVAVLSFASAAGYAQSAPTTSELPNSIEGHVTAVRGLVQSRASENLPWQAATTGQEVNQETEFRTAPRSSVTFVIGDDQTVTLDRLGAIRVLEAIKENGKVTTRLGMTYGRAHYQIESAGQEHDASIASPSSVLGIRGTVVALYDQPPFTPQATSFTGRATFRDIQKVVAFGAKNAGRARIDTESASAAATALKTTTLHPVAQSANDALHNVQFGFTYPNVGIFSLFDQARLQGFPAIGIIVDEQLAFRLFWTGVPGSDVDLTVISPLNQRLSAANPRVGTAVHEGNAVADASGTGLEAVTWLSNFPAGTYQIRSDLKSPDPVSVQLDALRDPTDQFGDFGNYGPFNFPLDASHPTNTITLDVSAPKPPPPPQPVAASAQPRKSPTATKKKSSVPSVRHVVK